MGANNRLIRLRQTRLRRVSTLQKIRIHELVAKDKVGTLTDIIFSSIQRCVSGRAVTCRLAGAIYPTHYDVNGIGYHRPHPGYNDVTSTPAEGH